MLVNARFITLAALVAVVAGQQVPPSQCVFGCSAAALPYATNTSCKAITDLCVCTDTGFQTAAGQCLQKNCTAADQAAAVQLQKSQCGNLTTSGGGNSTATTQSSNTGTASGSAATASKSNAAGAQVEVGQTGLFALGVAAAGAIVGGLLI